MATSYNGWPASADAQAINIVPLVVRGEAFPQGVKGGDVHTIFTYLCEQLHTRVEPVVRSDFHQADDWGYYFRRSVNNPNVYSCHASGTAIDYNATRHPNGRSGTWTSAQTAEIKKILAELEQVVRWLQGYDEMHFEIRGSAADARRVADKIRNRVIGQSAVAPKETQMDLSDSAKAYIAQKLNESEAQIMGAIRVEVADAIEKITGGTRTRDANGNVIDPNPAIISQADLYTFGETLKRDLAALMRSQHPG